MAEAVKTRRGRYREEDYRYAAAKVAALSVGLIPPQKMHELTDAPDASAFMARVAEYGFEPAGDGSDEAVLTAYLAGRYDALLSFCPSTPLARLCRLRYDCNNLKSAIKCRASGRDAAPLMIECGCIVADEVLDAAAKNDFSGLAALLPNMSEAASQASEALRKSGSSRTVDSLLDRACFADMRSAAAETGIPEVVALLKMKTDYTNFMTALRSLRLRDRELRRAVFDDSVISGGSVGMRELRDAADAEAVATLARNAGYSDAAKAISRSGGDAAALEGVSLALDNSFAAEINRVTGFRLLGAYPVIAYIAALEYEVKDLRIILSGLRAGDSRAVIGERLRDYYV